MEIFGDKISGNCLKIKYAADYLGLDYTWIDVDITRGESRTDEFLALSPNGQVPVVRLADGRVLSQSNAILRYIAHGTVLLPDELFGQALIDQWLFWEQYNHEPNVAVCRFDMIYRGKRADERDPVKVAKGEKALDLMDRHLESRDYFVCQRLTIADIALLAYTRLAHEGGFQLEGRNALTRWITRCEQDLRIASHHEQNRIASHG
ncbi:glutathione S-transferase family protein [Limoniibacter endophyticus]|uniref:Glutathione S-transferase n=1 Tax=Limoniibacter endophyticus TaxID=1565040 RepID=A0A8J3DMM2_9HYPH|nr:glutathione S-transferase family protein [Limoniibacter endophyticus]GHC64227.1 glutathione S-transferase [Limoniibacter endophyticus]